MASIIKHTTHSEPGSRFKTNAGKHFLTQGMKKLGEALPQDLGEANGITSQVRTELRLTLEDGSVRGYEAQGPESQYTSGAGRVGRGESFYPGS